MYRNMNLLTSVILVAAMVLYAGQAAANGRGYILFSSVQSGNWELWTVNHDGANMKRLTTGGQDEHSPAVSPDGKEIVYVNQDRELWLMRIDGTGNDRVPVPDGIYAQPAWIPDGRGIVYVKYNVIPRDTSEMWMALRDGNGDWMEPKRISSYPPMRLYPSFSPDGSKLAYSEFKRDEYQNVTEELGVLDLGTGKFEKITSEGADSYDPAWSPAGEQIAYTSNRGGNYDIWIMSVADGTHRQLTMDPSFDGEPAWSADGHEIAFVSARSGSRELWVISITGGQLRQLTKTGSAGKDPFWVK